MHELADGCNSRRNGWSSSGVPASEPMDAGAEGGGRGGGTVRKSAPLSRPCFVICPREEGQESVRLMSGGNCAPSVEPARAASSRRDSREEGGGGVA